jgi:lysosomal alpha-mannosidase
LALDRSEGGSSMHDGSVELMVHRRTLYDDSQGVGEPINETAYGQGLVIRGRHFLLLEPPESSALYHRNAAQHLFMNPISTYALPQVSYANYSNSYYQTWSALSESMPYNVHLLTFDQLAPKIFLLRLEHYFELNEDAQFSSPVKVDIQTLFKITDFVELTLGANLPLNDMKRLVWQTTNDESSYWKSTGMRNISLFCLVELLSITFLFRVLDYSYSMNSTIVTLNPMQIKTFEVTLQ